MSQSQGCICDLVSQKSNGIGPKTQDSFSALIFIFKLQDLQD